MNAQFSPLILLNHCKLFNNSLWAGSRGQSAPQLFVFLALGPKHRPILDFKIVSDEDRKRQRGMAVNGRPQSCLNIKWMDSGDTENNLLFLRLCIQIQMAIVWSTKQSRDLESEIPLRISVSVQFQWSHSL